MLAAAAAAALPAGAMAGGGGYDLPDLVGDAPDGAIMQPYTGVLPGGTQPVSRLLMRFNGYVHNDGAGPLDFQGDPTGGTMAQYVQPTGGGPLVQYPSQPGDTAPAFLYDTGDGHNHWHLQAADQYSLWDDARSAPVKAGSKTGFCLYDIEHVGAQGPASAVYDGPLTNSFCDRGDPAATGLHEGVSAGWRDTYDAGLAYQWVDVSDVAPGRYWLASKPDPDNVVRESDESNNGVAFSAQEVTVPGYVATATTASTLGGRVVRLPLAATTYSDPAFGVPGAMRYRITALPATGTVTVAGAPVAAGDLLPAGVSAVTYAAPADFTGAATVTPSPPRTPPSRIPPTPRATRRPVPCRPRPPSPWTTSWPQWASAAPRGRSRWAPWRSCARW
ncbi:MAG: lysyl oxidase family protein [Thermoleophilia bacterium]